MNRLESLGIAALTGAFEASSFAATVKLVDLVLDTLKPKEGTVTWDKESQTLTFADDASCEAELNGEFVMMTDSSSRKGGAKQRFTLARGGWNEYVHKEHRDKKIAVAGGHLMVNYKKPPAKGPTFHNPKFLEGL